MEESFDIFILIRECCLQICYSPVYIGPESDFIIRGYDDIGGCIPYSWGYIIYSQICKYLSKVPIFVSTD